MHDVTKNAVSMFAAIALFASWCTGVSVGEPNATTMATRKDLVWELMTQFKWETAKPSGLLVVSGRVPQWLRAGDGPGELRPALMRVRPDKRRIHIDGLLSVEKGRRVSMRVIQARSSEDAKEIVVGQFVVNSAAADRPDLSGI